MAGKVKEEGHRPTPGPWFAVGKVTPVGDPDGGGVCNLWCGSVTPDTPPYRGEICTIQSADHIGGISREEAEANARLIASAPSLYAEASNLIAAIDDMHGRGETFTCRVSVAVSALKAALKSATSP